MHDKKVHGMNSESPSILKDTFITDIIRFKEIDSTNDYAHTLALRGYPNGTVVVAERQTRGRGRHQNRWHSPEGNLYISVLIRPQKTFFDKLITIPAFTFLGAIASVDAISKICSLKTTLKWPNDVVYQDRKLGGILAEARFSGDDVLFVIIGIGLNINSKPETFPLEIKDTATSLIHILGKETNIEEVMTTLLVKMDQYYKRLISEGLDVILKTWMMHNSTVGRKVRIISGDVAYEGTAVGLDDLGRLLIEGSDGSTKALNSGHLFYL